MRSNWELPNANLEYNSVGDISTRSFRRPYDAKNVSLLHSEITSNGIRFVNSWKMAVCQLVPEHGVDFRGEKLEMRCTKGKRTFARAPFFALE